MPVYVGRFVFRPLKKIRLSVWSGVVAGKMFYDALTAGGVVVGVGGFFRVTPIRRVGSRLPVGGWLSPGETYYFEFAAWGSEAVDVVRGFVAGAGALKDFEVVTVEFNEVDLGWLVSAVEGAVKVSEGDGGEPVGVVYKVEHMPTFYRWHGAIVSYPSPRRLLASLLRRASVALGEGVEELFRRGALILAEHLELLYDGTRRQKIRISHGKEQPVFHGEARYLAVGLREIVGAVEAVLRAATVLGLGGSPGLGMGHLAGYEKMRPPHQLPPRVEAWGDEA